MGRVYAGPLVFVRSGRSGRFPTMRGTLGSLLKTELYAWFDVSVVKLGHDGQLLSSLLRRNVKGIAGNTQTQQHLTYRHLDGCAEAFI